MEGLLPLKIVLLILYYTGGILRDCNKLTFIIIIFNIGMSILYVFELYLLVVYINSKVAKQNENEKTK